MSRKKKNFLYFIISLIVITFSLYLYNAGNRGTSIKYAKNISIDNDETVTKIIISGKDDNALKLEKDKENNWIINNEYHANDLAVKDLIYVLKNISIRMPVPIAVKDSIDDLLLKEGLIVEIYAQRFLIPLGKWKYIPYNTNIRTILVGPNYKDEGTYMKLQNSNIPFIVSITAYEAGLRNNFSSNPHEWMNPVITNLRPSEIKEVKVLLPGNPDESFVLENKENEFLFKNPLTEEPLDISYDTSKVNRFLSAFRNLYFEKYLNEEENRQIISKIKDSKAIYVIELVDVYDNRQKIEIYQKSITKEEMDELGVKTDIDPNIFYLKTEDSVFVYARYYVFNRILKPLSFYKENN